tara:strand:+ start:1141 stop:1368 length:228 start_codon:yes stop_codon:yes gene_type:complete
MFYSPLEHVDMLQKPLIEAIFDDILRLNFTIIACVGEAGGAFDRERDGDIPLGAILFQTRILVRKQIAVRPFLLT